MIKTKTVKTVKRKKQALTKRGYSGVNVGRLSPYKGEYRTSSDIVAAEGYELVARSRELALNDGTINKLCKLLSANVVGSQGIGIAPRSTDTNGTLDSIANNIISKCFAAWSKYPTVDNSYSWVDVQRVLVESLVTDGECFIRIYRGKKFGKFQIQLQLLPTEFVDVKYNDPANNIVNGIELNEFGRPVAYYVYSRNPKSNSMQPLTRIRLTENEIIHFYIKNKPDQLRGVPLIAPILSQLLDLKHYKYLELVNARISSGTQGFIVQDSAGASKYRGQSEDATAQSIVIEGGSIQQLPAGCRIEKYDPSHPSNNYSEFVKSLSRDIASGMNLSYNDLFSDLNSVTYSSLRWGALSDREQFRMFSRILIDNVLEPIYLYFIEMSLLSGTLTDGKIVLPYQKIEKYSVAQYRPRSYPWIDPAKDAAAIETALQNNTTTLTKVLSEQGYDLETILSERQRENELAAKYNISLSEIYTKNKNINSNSGNTNNGTDSQ